MIKKYNLLFIIAIFLSVVARAQEFKTYTYFVNDSISLDLDLFVPDNNTSLKTPLVIYVHGGGFSGGDRTGGHNLAKYLFNKNIACASISYSLYMKGKDFGCKGVLSEKIKAIQIAASQLWLATDYLIKKSDEINIDTTKVFIAGSSAGAETILHASYWDRKEMQLFEHKLDKEFKYAGAISGAGAIMDLNLITKTNMIPMLFFHGDKDRLVPYATAAHHYCPPNSSGWLMFFGSLSIAQHLHSLNESFQLITFEGGGHSYAGVFFYQNQQTVVDFITKIVSKEKFRLYKTIKTTP